MRNYPTRHKPTPFPFPFTHTSLWVHALFPTLEFQPLLTAAIRPSVFHLIQTELESMDSHALAIQGTDDHIHILFRQTPTLAVSEIIKQVKGASSHEINALGLTSTRFAWQSKFHAYSVEQHRLHLFKQFIDRQAAIHQLLSAKDEISALQVRNGTVPDEWLQEPA